MERDEWNDFGARAVDSTKAVAIRVCAAGLAVAALWACSPGGSSSGEPTAIVAQAILPTGWLHAEIGAGDGGADYDAGVFTVTSNGEGIPRNDTDTHGDDDGVHFVYKEMTGDVDIVVRVTSDDEVANAQAGVMVRASTDPYARMGAGYFDEGNYGVGGFSCNPEQGDFSAFSVSSRIMHASAPYATWFDPIPTRDSSSFWLRLQRIGNDFAVSRARDVGEARGPWVPMLGGEFAGEDVLIGFYVSGASSQPVASATFKFEVEHIGPAADYLEYGTSWIGSSAVAFSTDFVRYGLQGFYVAPDGTSYKPAFRAAPRAKWLRVEGLRS